MKCPFLLLLTHQNPDHLPRLGIPILPGRLFWLPWKEVTIFEMESQNLAVWKHLVGCWIQLSTLNIPFALYLNMSKTGNTHESSLHFWTAILIGINFFLFKNLSLTCFPSPLYLICLWPILRRNTKEISSHYIKDPQLFDECYIAILTNPSTTPILQLFFYIKMVSKSFSILPILSGSAWGVNNLKMYVPRKTQLPWSIVFVPENLI